MYESFMCAVWWEATGHPALAFTRTKTVTNSLLPGRKAGRLGHILPRSGGWGWVPAQRGEGTGGSSSDSKHSLYYVFDPEEKLSAGWGKRGLGREGPPCLGVLAPTPYLGSQAMPSWPPWSTRAVP